MNNEFVSLNQTFDHHIGQIQLHITTAGGEIDQRMAGDFLMGIVTTPRPDGRGTDFAGLVIGTADASAAEAATTEMLRTLCQRLTTGEIASLLYRTYHTIFAELEARDDVHDFACALHEALQKGGK